MQHKIVDYLIYMERNGFRIAIDTAELNPNGIGFSVFKSNGELHFTGALGPKALGEWIKCQRTAMKKN